MKKSEQINEIPTVSADTNALGDVKINHDVIARIVHLSCMEVPGVKSVGSGFSFSDLIPAKSANKGVRIGEDESGSYTIEVRVIMEFGVEMGRTAQEIQERVRDQIDKMTGSPVARVDVIIEGVEMETPKEEKAQEWSKYYTAGPHLAGKNYSQVLWTQERWEEFGIKADIAAYDVYINYPLGHRLASAGH